ncbi:MAG: hypothetical protein AABX47_02170 [Nanoarchaeota archaeon]
MPRKPNYLNPDTDQDLQVRPLDLVYPGFLSRRDMKRLARCTTELKEVAVERPKYIDIALDENLKYLLRTIPAARRHQDELQQLFAEIFCEVKRYGHLYHKIQETLKGETGTVAVISEWAQWIDGTVYEINQPEVRIMPILLNWAQMIESPSQAGYRTIAADHQRDDTITIPWQSSLNLTERMMIDPNIILITAGIFTGNGQNEHHVEQVDQSYKDALIRILGSAYNRSGGHCIN